jgi:hypothetical protein
MLRVSDSLLSLVQSSKDRLPDGEAAHVLACQSISKRVRSTQKEIRFLILTEFNFYFYESKSFSKSVKVLESHSWEQLQFLSCESDLMTAHFRFSDGNVTLSCPNGMDVVATVSQHLRTIFTPAEFPRESIGVDDCYLEGYEPKKDAVVRRLRFKAFISKRPLPPGLEQEIVERINSSRAAERDNIAESFDLSPFLPYYDQMDLILDAIMVMPEARRLIVPASTPGSPLWPKLSKFFAVNETISQVETKEPPDTSFRAFVRELSGKRASGIHELKFSDAEYDAEFMVQLAILFESREITVLSVTNRATETGVVTLAALLPSCQGFQNLRELTLVGCPLVQAKAFLGPLPKLRTLSVDEKSLDIGEFIAQFCECANSELLELTLLSGHVTSPIPYDRTLPSCLVKLAIPDVVWSGTNLSGLFSVIANRGDGSVLQLNVARAAMDDDQWGRFDAFLQEFRFGGFAGLVFDGNHVGPGFAGLLARCENLAFLSLNACEISQPETHRIIAESIAGSKTLHNLSIQGRRHESYRNFIEIYISAVLQNKSLRVFDISGNRIGNAVLGILGPIFHQHSKLSEVLFDRNGVTDLEGLQKLYEEAGRVDRRILIRFPNEDVERLRAAGQIAEIDVHKLRVQCADAVRRRVKNARGHTSVDEDGEPRGPTMRPGEFLEMLVRGMKGGFPADVADVVHGQIAAWIADEEWAKSTAVTFLDDDKGGEIAESVTLEALFDAIT